MNSYLKIAIVIVAFVAGFFLGRKFTNVKEKIEYVKGEAIHDTIVINEPTFVEIPSKPKYIYKYDTIVVDNIQYISEKIDTSAIIQDYILMRTYEFKVFNSDTLGKFDVRQQIGYNKLLSFDYTFTPITKQVTRFREPVFTPFVTVGYSTNRTVLGGLGAYYRRLGVEYLINIPTSQIEVYNFNQNNQFNGLEQNKIYHTFKVNYRF
jgi:hypothetical protein